MTQVALTATFSAAGPFTWTCPAGVTSVTVAATGAGGGGGNAGATSGSNGGGGGGGEAALEAALAVTPSLSYSGTVGAGGAAQSAGGDTSFAGDGGVVVYAHGGGAGGSAGASGSGAAGAGGDGSVNSVSAAGGAGDTGNVNAAAGWSLVQQSAAQTTTGANTLPAATTAGNLLVAVVASSSSAGLDTPSGWSNQVTERNGTASEITIFAYFDNPGGLSSFAFTGGSGTNHAVVMEFTCPGVAQVSIGTDIGIALAGAVASDTVSTAGLGVTQAGDLVIGGAFEHLASASTVAWTDPAGFTQAAGLITGSTPNHCYAAYELAAPSAGTQTVTFASSVASTLSTGWAGVLLTFSAPSAGGGGGGAAGVGAAAAFPGNSAAGPVAGAASGGTFGGGAGGAGSTTGAGPGAAGTSPGGGGGGALSAGTGRSGGAGADGQVVITWTQADPVALTASTAGGSYTFTAPFGATSVNAQAWGAGAGGYNAPASNAAGAIQGRPGSTVWQVYGITNKQQRVQAANIFDGFVGIPLALQAQKVYYNETGSDSIAQYVDVNHPQAVGLLAAAGCQIVLCPKANRGYATGTDDFAALQSAVADIASHIGAANLTVVLWQECTDQWFSSAQDYLNYWNHYVRAIPSNVKVAVDVGAGPGLAADQAYAQAIVGSRVRPPDIVAVDVYDSSYSHGRNFLTYPPGDPNYPGIADIADTAGVPFGIYEWGQSASASYPSSNPDPNWHDYIYGPHGLLTIIQARIAAGKPVHHVMYYGGSGPGNNDIESSTDFRIPAMVDIYNAMTSGAGGAPGGAGGGGGEYAAESSLAITDSRVYALTVGAGGGGNASGGSSAVAGDSVTVTGHGGSAATTQTAGGAGGSGSTNATHHSGGSGGAGGGTGGGGGGGGGSGGTAAAGNAGAAGTATAGGAGGAAVAGGGRGGFGSRPTVSGLPGQSPGGGGGGGGASSLNTGPGADGQVILSGFAVNPAGPASFAVAPVALSGSGNVNVSSFALAPVGLSGTANVSMISFVQQGPTSTGPFTLNAASTAGNTLIARVAQSTQAPSTPPAGWQLVAAQNTGGATGRAEMWILPGSANPGGITSIAWSGGTALRGYVAEYSCPAGYLITLDGTPGTASGTTPVTSFPVSTSGANLGGDAALAFFVDQFSVNPSGSSFTTPPGWTRETFVQQSIPDCYAGYYKLGLSAATQSVTGTFSTSTSQVGWAAILATFTAVPLAAASSTFALAPLGFAGTANAVVSGGQVPTSGGLALAPPGFQSPSQAATFGQNGNSPLPIRVEILINGVWCDITSYAYQRDGIVISGRGRPDEASTPQPAQCTLTLNNRDGSFSPAGTGQFSPYLTRNTQIRISVVNAVTPQGAWYTGYRFWGEVPAWPPQWDPTGADVYVSITACGVLQRMRQSKFSASPLARYYANLVNVFLSTGGVIGGVGSVGFTNTLVPAGYWPCEDGTGASSFASGLPGGSPMTWSGTPGLAADSDVAGSAPFAQLNGSAWTGTPGAFSAGGQTWATAGTYTWLCPAGVTTIKAECWGAGGGGSSGDNTSGSGGGGGEYAAEPNLAVTPGKTYTLVIGGGGSGGAGTFKTSPLSGTAGNPTTFSGDTVTVTAHAGKGGTSGGGGQGGRNSANTTHFNGGNGGSSGSGFGGCGGGGSAGNAAAGNSGGSSSGTTGGSGGTAKPGGGPGGQGGNGATAAQGNAGTSGLMAFPGPGGGGGAGGFNGSNNYGKPGGGGQAGQVTISFGQVPTPNANVLRAIVDVPSTGAVDGAFLVQALTTGTVADFHIKYHTGGNLQLNGNNASGSQLFTSGSKSFGANGQPLLVSAELTQKTATQIAWKLTAITPGATQAVATYTGTITGTLGSVTAVKTNSAAPFETGATGVGHISLQYAVDPIGNLAPAFAAYTGELAATRITRLCQEQRVPLALTGSASDTPQMGAQPAGLLVDLLQDCENADLGQLFERRDTFGLGYVTRAALQNQSAAVTLDYSAGQLAQGLQPTDDDQLTRNDIIATRAGGGTSYEAVLSTGPLSVQDPPNGVGLYQYSVTVNLFADAQLASFANWLLTLGTLDEFRYPVITTDLTRSEVSDGTFSAIAGLDIGSFLQIVNPPAWLPQTPINQLCYGFTETLNGLMGPDMWTIAINAVPEDPYGGQSLPTW